MAVAAQEFEFSILTLAQGHCRQAFKGLRLVLELCLQAALLSANELQLREWLENRADTNWSAIVDHENGVLSKRFAKSFFPDLDEHVANFRSLAEKFYRECSECVHGNTPRKIPLPEALGFEQNVFDAWHAKADLVAFAVTFTFSMRYMRELSESDLAVLEPFLMDRVGHIAAVRELLGGPVKG